VTTVEKKAETSEDNSFALLNAVIASGGRTQSDPHLVLQAAVAVAEPQAKPQVLDATRVLPADDPTRMSAEVSQACREPLNRLVEELNLCRRYYEATFPNQRIDRLVFVGGEARQRALCQQIAREMGLAAQIGDPLVRMGKTCTVSASSGIDRRQPQPSWAVAIGLSMGQASGTEPRS
jgi:Tfp pilus assembly PilM family ATPase